MTPIEKILRLLYSIFMPGKNIYADWVIYCTKSIVHIQKTILMPTKNKMYALKE